MSRTEHFATVPTVGRAQQMQASLRHWWATRPPRERKLLQLCGVVMTVALVWWVGIEPALKSIARSEEQLPRLRYEAAQLDALLLEAQTLDRRRSGRIPTADIPQALEASLQRKGLSADISAASGGTAGRQPAWQVNFENVSAAQLMDWLAGMSEQLPLAVARLDLARARVDGRDRPGQVSGSIVLGSTQEEQP